MCVLLLLSCPWFLGEAVSQQQQKKSTVPEEELAGLGHKGKAHKNPRQEKLLFENVYFTSLPTSLSHYLIYSSAASSSQLCSKVQGFQLGNKRVQTGIPHIFIYAFCISISFFSWSTSYQLKIMS